jgi:hypothetical protein
VKWISVKDRLPDQTIASYFVFDRYYGHCINDWSNVCICEYTKSPYKNGDKCKCGKWYRECTLCQTLNRNYIPSKTCGISAEINQCSWKFIYYCPGEFRGDDTCYGLTSITHWMPLPPNPDKEEGIISE